MMVNKFGPIQRIETRKYYIVSDIDWLQGKENWKNLKTIGMVISETVTVGCTFLSINKGYPFTPTPVNGYWHSKPILSNYTVQQRLSIKLEKMQRIVNSQ